MHDDVIFKLFLRNEWLQFREIGKYSGSVADRRDGFIHLSTANQVSETARKHFLGVGNIVLAAIRAKPLGEKLKWEPSRGGALFPHLYGVLSISDVVWDCPVELDHHGVPQVERLISRPIEE